ncbi:MAG TPA: TIGR03086 family metal-binding protein [Kineosporiaceae bacterium]|jgi:uncharacterized protein (TIGR03086 family)|nr:TIGR03086 family metal-binding protein [Kineosporiaceae bacterium]
MRAEPIVHASPALALYGRACAAFDRQVRAVRDPWWSAPTPCPDWTVRGLVNHVVVEDLCAAELLAGRTLADVGSSLDGDQLGAVPLQRWSEATQRALAAAAANGAMDRPVELSFGVVPGSEYAMQLFADHLVHAWDLAIALGTDLRLDSDLVEACLEWFADVEDAYRSAGAIGPRIQLPPGADRQTTLLAAFGRTS